MPSSRKPPERSLSKSYTHLRFTGDRLTHRAGPLWQLTGALELHGVSRTISLDTTYLGSGYGVKGETRIAFQARTELHREDFTLTWQKLLPHGIATIGTTIKIEIDVQLVPLSTSALADS